MNILLIPDSFKGSATSMEVIDALTRGFQTLDQNVNLFSVVASDGGEGFLDSIDHQLEVETIWHDSLDPIGRPIETTYLFDRSNNTAYIELAKASGLDCLSRPEQNPMTTTTIGTGMQILHAINKGAKTIYVGLGGSATNDGGIGLASVLGYRFLDENGTPILPIGKQLSSVRNIEGAFTYEKIKIKAINDVANPLYGPHGAAHTYAEQKGANSEEIKILDQGLVNLASVVEKYDQLEHHDFSGAGAAGGVGYGLKVFCNAEFISGTDFLFDLAKVEMLLSEEKIDVIITGEGRIDSQTMQGKLIQGILDLAKPKQIKVVAICGQLNLSTETYKDFGLHYATTIAKPGTSPEESIKNALQYIEEVPRRIWPFIS